MNNRLLHRFCIVLGIIMFAMPLHAGTVRIMGIGDSITEGGGTFTSYMGPLARLLSAAGFDYEFVGPRNGSSAGISYKHAALVVRIPNMLNRELTPYIGLSRRTLY